MPASLAQGGPMGEVPAWHFRPLPDMDEGEFRRWAALLEQRTGVVLSPQRKSFLVTSLGARMQALGIAGYADYYAYLTDGRRGAVEWQLLVDRLTVHETRFFRDPATLELIRQYCIEERVPERTGASVELWSVGCATGEESYTLAMCCDRWLRERGGEYYLAVTGSDISLNSLACGRTGVYQRLKLRQVPNDYLAEYFRPVDLEHYRVIDRLRERICFTRLNIQEPAPLAKMDAIVCQNVLIYFAQPARHAILARLAEHLKPGGLLVLGLGDVVGWRHPQLVQLACPGVLAYRRMPVAAEGAH